MSQYVQTFDQRRTYYQKLPDAFEIREEYVVSMPKGTPLTLLMQRVTKGNQPSSVTISIANTDGDLLYEVIAHGLDGTIFEQAKQFCWKAALSELEQGNS